MIEKLSLPFPYLSDPDRTAAVIPYRVADEIDDRQIARPALILVTPNGHEAFRFVSRDFADRTFEEEVLAAVEEWDLPATSQEPPSLGPAEHGPRSLSPGSLRVYYREARFAALAMGRRHGHLSPAIKDDSKAYVAEMDRYTAALDWLADQSGR